MKGPEGDFFVNVDSDRDSRNKLWPGKWSTAQCGATIGFWNMKPDKRWTILPVDDNVVNGAE